MQVLEAFQALTALSDIVSVSIAFASSFLIGLLLVLTKRWHGILSMDYTDGIQKFHTVPTPRIGGIPIVLGLVLVWGKSSHQMRELLTPILLAGMPAFLFGMAEDLTKKVGVVQRLLATMVSGFLAWWMTDYSLSRLDIWGVDALMQFTLVSVLVTSFAVGGVANAINIIDGFNGLSTLTCSIAFSGFALIAFQVGDHNLAMLCLILAACVWGFFWINWPFGKMFLGDGGAYFVGFALAWIAILLIERNHSVSAFAALLICILPVTEVLFSIFRRRVRQQHLGQPDRLHFHSIMHRRYITRWLSNWPASASNSLVGILVGLMSLLAVVSASNFFESTLLCLGSAIFLALGYVTVYARMVRHHWCSPVEFLLVKPMADVSQS
jgi:UDP-N-acetylmuramyl pentapeptide phosphotransferase/UDP-N-acetylglucosamine-1-phosphate transferase